MRNTPSPFLRIIITNLSFHRNSVLAMETNSILLQISIFVFEAFFVKKRPCCFCQTYSFTHAILVRATVYLPTERRHLPEVSEACDDSPIDEHKRLRHSSG